MRFKCNYVFLGENVVDVFFCFISCIDLMLDEMVWVKVEELYGLYIVDLMVLDVNVMKVVNG